MDETDDALAAFGLVRELVREGAQDDSDAPFPLYKANLNALSIFCSTWHQWRKVAHKDHLIRDCMDWGQVESALNLSGIERAEWPQIFDLLKHAQVEALDYQARG